MEMLPIWSICTTLGLRGGDFTSNAQAFENKGARISFHPSPARQAGRQAGRYAGRQTFTITCMYTQRVATTIFSH